MKKPITYLYLLGTLLTTGCVTEGPQDCPQGELTFHYTYNEVGDDHLTEDIHNIRLYMFDRRTGLLVDILDLDDDDIARGYARFKGLPDGVYSFVAWGHGSDDLSQNYSDIEMIDAASHDYTGIEIGRTTLDYFYMMVKMNELPADIEGDVTPVQRDFEDLFFAIARDVAVNGGLDRAVEFDFMRNSHYLNIEVTELDKYPQTRAGSAGSAGSAGNAGSSGSPVNIFVVGRNGRYRYDNSIDRAARLVRYEPEYLSLTESAMTLGIKTLRLDIDRHLTDPVLLHIENAEGRDLIEPLDVIQTLLASRGPQSGQGYGNQEWLDRTYEFPMKIDISSNEHESGDVELIIKITVNGWTITYIVPDP